MKWKIPRLTDIETFERRARDAIPELKNLADRLRYFLVGVAFLMAIIFGIILMIFEGNPVFLILLGICAIPILISEPIRKTV